MNSLSRWLTVFTHRDSKGLFPSTCLESGTCVKSTCCTPELQSLHLYVYCVCNGKPYAMVLDPK